MLLFLRYKIKETRNSLQNSNLKGKERWHVHCITRLLFDPDDLLY